GRVARLRGPAEAAALVPARAHALGSGAQIDLARPKRRTSAAANAAAFRGFQRIGIRASGFRCLRKNSGRRGFARAGLVDAPPGRADDGRTHGPQVEILVREPRDESAERWAEVVDPRLAPEVPDELGAEGAGRVHRGAGEGAAEADVDRDREPD